LYEYYRTDESGDDAIAGTALNLMHIVVGKRGKHYCMIRVIWYN
jgi:hypothetical protein